MFDGGLYGGDPAIAVNYWIGKRDNVPPQGTQAYADWLAEWERFYTDVDVNSKIGSVS
jgi:hypothetical protein